MWTSRWGEWATLLKSSFTLPYSLVDDTNGVKRNISLMVLEMGIFLTTISNKPMNHGKCCVSYMYLSSVWTKWKLDTKCIYLFIFWAGPNLAKTLLDLKHDPACLQTTTLIILKENNLWCIFSASNIGHKLKQSRPPGSITLFLSKVGMVYFTSRLILNEQNKRETNLADFYLYLSLIASGDVG